MPASEDARSFIASESGGRRSSRLARLRATVVHAGPTPETAPSADLLPAAAEQVVAYEREWRWRPENLREYAADDAVVAMHRLPVHETLVLLQSDS